MSKTVIADAIQRELEVPATRAHAAAGAVLEALTKALKKEGKLTIVGFGTFRVTRTKARTGKNPRTGEPLKIKAGKAVRFKAGAGLKAAV